jgi:hypothetical protein
MPNQERKIETDSKIDRRKVIQAALGSAPLIATLTSRPVHAVQGLSNMLSGDASVCRGDNYYGGMSPGFWKTPNGGTDLGDRWAEAWDLTGYTYGELKDDQTEDQGNNGNGNGNGNDDYTGGTVIAEFGTDTLRELLDHDPNYVENVKGSGIEIVHLVAGLLNARYFDAKGDSEGYMFTEKQFWALYSGSGEEKVPDAYISLRDMIESNYHGVPGDSCGSWSSNDD